MTTLFVALFAALTASAFVLAVFALYGVLILAASWLSPRRHATRVPDGALRIAAIVVAHDEERVVADSVSSLVRQEYPAERRDVVVVADRCKDDTAGVAERNGATVLRRHGGPSGKTAAVAFGVEHVVRTGGFDAVAIFDADNVVLPDFLSRVSERLAAGERVVQGFVDAKNPAASWVAASSTLGFLAIASVVQEPRERLGLSTPPMGTGFCLRLPEARRFLADARSLTDDLELGAMLALAGLRVAFEERARVLDEKPVRLETAVTQRTRWMRGRYDVVARRVPELLRAAAGPKLTLGARFRLVDAAIQLLSPSVSFCAVALAVLAGLMALAALLSSALLLSSMPIWAPSRLFGVALVLYAVPAIGMMRFEPPAFVWLCYVVQPAYLILSAPLAVLGFLGRNSREWKRTHKG